MANEKKYVGPRSNENNSVATMEDVLTLSPNDKVKADVNDNTPSVLSDKVENSIEVDTTNHKLRLVGDMAIPGTNKVYGTDENGNRTWLNAPTGTGGSGGTDEAKVMTIVKAMSY